MGVMRDIAVGFATTLAGSGIGTYRTDGTAYAAGETAIVHKDMPASPDRVICLTAVPMTDETVLPSGLVLVQCKLRGNQGAALDVDDLGDAVFDLMHGITNSLIGTVPVTQCLRQTSVPAGVDSSRRWSRYDHYYVELDYAATKNRPAGGWD